MQLTVYRRDNRKRNGRSWHQWIIVGSTVLTLIAMTVAIYQWRRQLMTAGTTVRRFVLESPYFSVREIQVRGGEKFGGNEIITMAGLKQGMNIWRIEPATIEQKVAKHPWVRRVLVRREFPRRVVIEIEERAPRASVAMGKLYYVIPTELSLRRSEQEKASSSRYSPGYVRMSLEAVIRRSVGKSRTLSDLGI